MDYPALYQHADAASLTAQSRYVLALRWRLGGLLVAAIGGALGYSVGQLHLGGLLSLLGFLVALGAESYTALVRPDRVWYEGRAAAESAKTLAWRYVVRGEPFGAGVDDRDADRRLLDSLNEVLQELTEVPLDKSVDADRQITADMRRLRGSPFEERRKLYAQDRIADQETWYHAKSVWNGRRSHTWTVVTVGLELVGVLAAALRAFNVVDIDLFGILAAATATVTAWVQAKQHQTLSTAYAVAAQELASIRSEIDSVPEAEWAQFVRDSEEAISREHTLWRASRGVRMGWRGSERRET